MIVGIGVDIVAVARLAAVIERQGERFVRRVFTEAEAGYCRDCARPEQRFATRFAAKEAVLKALGTGWQNGTAFGHIEVLNDELGAPSLVLAGRTLEIAHQRGIARWHISMSHDEDYAIAQVVAEGD